MTGRRLRWGVIRPFLLEIRQWADGGDNGKGPKETGDLPTLRSGQVPTRPDTLVGTQTYSSPLPPFAMLREGWLTLTENLPPEGGKRMTARLAVNFKAEVIRYPSGHFDIYLGKHFEPAVSDHLEFFSSHL